MFSRIFRLLELHCYMTLKMAEKTDTKRPHFTAQEELFLVTEVQKRKHIIEGKLSPSLTNKMKKMAWKEVVDLLNAYVYSTS